MKFTKIALSTIGALALLASTAFAGSTVTGQGWFVTESLASTIPQNDSGLGLANFTFNGGYSFTYTASGSGSSYWNSTFLSNGGATNVTFISGANGVTSLDQAMSDGSTYGTIYEFTGTAYFVNGQTYTVHHDDGVVEYINGVEWINAPQQTSPEDSSFVYTGATGNQSFDLLYGECCGQPAVLETTLAAPTPEPGSMLLFGTGLLGLAGVARRRFNR